MITETKTIRIMQIAIAIVMALALALCMCMQLGTDNAYAAKKTLKAGNVSLSSSTYTVKFTANFHAAPSVQKPSVKVKYSGKTLKSGKDYTVKYSNASSKHAGTYKVTVTGKGKYKGTVKKSYKIKPITATSSNCILVANSYSYFTGGKVGPAKSAISVRFKEPNANRGRHVAIGSGFNVVSGPSYSKASWATTGKATVSMQVKGTGDFTGSPTLKGTYVVYPTKVTISSLTASGHNITVKWNKPKGNFDSYHAIAYTDNGTYYKQNCSKDDTSCKFVGVVSGTYHIYVTPVMSESTLMDKECPGYVEKSITIK